MRSSHKKKWVLEFVPTGKEQAELAREILTRLHEAGRTWALSYRNKRRKKYTDKGRTKSLAHYLVMLPEVKTIHTDKFITTKKYYKEA